MVPAGVLLLVFLTYPLGLGLWLGLTNTSIGQAGRFVGLAQFASLMHDSVFWLVVFNTILYTVVAFALALAKIARHPPPPHPSLAWRRPLQRRVAA